MRLGLLINDFGTEQAVYTTTRLALAATAAGHEVWYLSLSDFSYEPDENIGLYARTVGAKSPRDIEAYFAALKDPSARVERLRADDLDILMLRYDPAEELRRPWAQSAGVLFGQLAAARGTLVVNDPFTLASAISKTYFQHFPESVRPRTLISRDAARIKQFIRELGGHAVLKPLQGSGGANVFFVQPNSANVNQIIEVISRDGYVVAQQYLEAARQGDMRLFVMNGQPLVHQGKICAFNRVQHDGNERRSNMHVGAGVAPAEVDERALRLVEIVRPKLLADGMFLVGLDIIGDKLMEINVFTPGGFGSAQALQGVDFSVAVIAALERKLEYKRQYPRRLGNAQLAAL